MYDHDYDDLDPETEEAMWRESQREERASVEMLGLVLLTIFVIALVGGFVALVKP